MWVCLRILALLLLCSPVGRVVADNIGLATSARTSTHHTPSTQIASLTPIEKFSITERWMAGATLLLLLILLWNRLLKNQVKKRTASLLQSQQNLSRAEQIAHLGHWQWDFATDSVHWSDEVYRLFGYPP